MGWLGWLLVRLGLLGVLGGGAVLGAAYAGIFDADGPLDGSALVGPDSPTSYLPFVDAGIPSVEEATDALIGPATADLDTWAQSLAALVEGGIDGGDLLSAADRAQVAAALRDPAVVAALQAQADDHADRALDAHTLDGAPGTAGDTPGSAVEAFFVNGILNTAQDAEAGRAALEDLLGVRVTGYYNHSSVETASLQADFCRRALGLESQGIDLSAWGSVAGLCRGVEGVAEVASAALEGFRGAVEVSAMRIFGVGSFFEADTAADIAASAVNDVLVEDVRAAVEAGRPLVLVGHSQGTMFAGNAFRQTADWWAGLVEGGRACGPNPVAALYISPAFSPRTSINEHYVGVAGDILSVTGVTSAPATAEPSGGQQGLGPLDLHALGAYLLRGTETRGQVEAKFDLAAEYARQHGGVTLAPDGGVLPAGVFHLPSGASDGLFVAPGEEARVDLRLPCRPEAPVTLSLDVGAGPTAAGLSLAPATLEFTATNWNEKQAVTMSAAPNAAIGPATIRAVATSDDSFYLGAPPATLRVVVRGDGAATAGEAVRVDGSFEVESLMRAAIAEAMAAGLEQVPADQRAAIGAQMEAAVEQLLDGMIEEVNTLTLEFPAAGGPVTGRGAWGMSFASPALPGCAIESLGDLAFAGEFDAATGGLAGTVAIETDIQADGCGGFVPPPTVSPTRTATWDATLDGSIVTGRLVEGGDVTARFTGHVRP